MEPYREIGRVFLFPEFTWAQTGQKCTGAPNVILQYSFVWLNWYLNW